MTRTPTNEAIGDSGEKSLSIMQTASGEVGKPKHRHPYLKSVAMADVNSPYPESSPSPRIKSNSLTGKSSTAKIKKTRSESKKQIIEYDGIVIKPVIGGERPQNLLLSAAKREKKVISPVEIESDGPQEFQTFKEIEDDDKIPSQFSLDFQDPESSVQEFEPQQVRIPMDSQNESPLLRSRVGSQKKMNSKPSLKEQYGIQRPGYMHRNQFFVKQSAKNPRYINYRSQPQGYNQYPRNIEKPFLQVPPQIGGGSLPPIGETFSSSTVDREGIKMLKSIFLDRPGTIFFQYPQFLPVYKSECRVEMFLGMKYPRHNPPRISYKFQQGTSIYNCVLDTLHNAGLSSTVSSNWCVHFSTNVKAEHLQFLQSHQKLNHFPGTIQLGHKDLMWRNVSRMKRGFGGEYDICPTTYILPEDYQRFAVDRDNYPIWIMKPNALSCGRGIKLIGRRTVVDKLNNYVISKYILYPHLINGFKYDLRLYVVVTGFDPLKIYLYREGLVRFATQTYSVAPRSLKKRFMHLTNYSVNKNSMYFHQAQQNDFSRSKWSLKMLRQKYQELGIDFYSVFARIKDLIIKTLISVEPHVVSSQHRHTSLESPCFELFGFDVLLDYQMKPWLIEINNGPSLSGSSQLDRKIKTMLVTDMLNLAGLKTSTMPNKKSAAPKFRQPQQAAPLIDEYNLLKLGQRAHDILLEYQEEYHRKGQFERIFPLVQNYWHYSQFFEASRPGGGNDILWRYLQSVHQSGGSTQRTLEGAFKKVSAVKV